jgi:hypothetical protein
MESGCGLGPPVAASGRDGPVNHHIKKIAIPMIAAMANAA